MKSQLIFQNLHNKQMCLVCIIVYNATHYKIGLLTTISPPALIVAAVYAIPVFRRICHSKP